MPRGVYPRKPRPETWPTRYVEDENGCWIWNGCANRAGYGQAQHGGKLQLVHRLFYERYVGPIHDGLVLDHLCSTPPCVNPAHLEPVTNQENVRRAVALRTACTRGHEYTAQSMYVTPEGGRQCLTCKNERRRKDTVRREIAKRPNSLAARIALYAKAQKAET